MMKYILAATVLVYIVLIFYSQDEDRSQWSAFG